MRQIEDWHGVDRKIFENEILPANQPAVLRGLLRDWPVVQAGRQSPASAANYFKQFDVGGTVSSFVGRPEIKGRFFYSDDFRGFNFDSIDVPISTALDTLVSLAGKPEPPAIALQAIDVPEMMPGFPKDNEMPLLDSSIAPRVWISSQSMIAPHFDVSYNIACVVSGRRKFTVFPPDQIGNIYIGPLVTTPGGPPISVVDLRNPDLERFPRFAQALESAQEATLEPGDAVYIPILWWHGVESLDALNILVNYWWNDNLSKHQNPVLSLIHTMALMSGLPAIERDAWREIFECLAFHRNGEPGAHMPADLRDVMGNLSPEERDQALAIVAERLQSRTG